MIASATKIVAAADTDNVMLTAKGGKIVAQPSSKLISELNEQIKAHKGELLAYLKPIDVYRLMKVIL